MGNIDDLFTGMFHLEFIGGIALDVEIVRTYHDREGRLLYAIGKDDTIYNWFTIMSAKKLA